MTHTQQRERGIRGWFKGSDDREILLQGNPIEDTFPKPLTNILFPGGGGISGSYREILAIGPDVLAERTRFNTQADVEAINIHFARFKKRHRILFAIYFAIAVLAAASVAYISELTGPSVRAFAQISVVNIVLVSFLILGMGLVSLYIQFQILSKIAGFVVDGYFADSIAAIALLHLIIDLEKDLPLTPRRKKNLLRRVNFVANMTRALPTLNFNFDDRNRDWLRQHFREMALYIREREKWLVVPRDSTLATLRRDFKQLAPLYIHGNYGNFIWPDLAKEPEKRPLPGFGEKFVAVLPRFLGIILPLILMGLYLWRPTIFPFINLDSDAVTLIFLAWLLLAIDANLKLGITAGLTNLAKGIKELK